MKKHKRPIQNYLPTNTYKDRKIIVLVSINTLVKGNFLHCFRKKLWRQTCHFYPLTDKGERTAFAIPWHISKGDHSHPKILEPKNQNELEQALLFSSLEYCYPGRCNCFGAFWNGTFHSSTSPPTLSHPLLTQYL